MPFMMKSSSDLRIVDGKVWIPNFGMCSTDCEVFACGVGRFNETHLGDFKNTLLKIFYEQRKTFLCLAPSLVMNQNRRFN